MSFLRTQSDVLWEFKEKHITLSKVGPNIRLFCMNPKPQRCDSSSQIHVTDTLKRGRKDARVTHHTMLATECPLSLCLRMWVWGNPELTSLWIMAPTPPGVKFSSRTSNWPTPAAVSLLFTTPQPAHLSLPRTWQNNAEKKFTPLGLWETSRGFHLTDRKKERCWKSHTPFFKPCVKDFTSSHDHRLLAFRNLQHCN